jgi:hypothetical protein
LTKALPRLLGEVRDLVGERRITIVFDRGGWSPALFGTMIKDGFDVLTYRKGRCRRINERRFIRRRVELDGRLVPCGASRLRMAGPASSCAQPALAWRGSSSSAATFPSASRSETSTSGHGQARHRT